jgi:hypothetical protein
MEHLLQALHGVDAPAGAKGERGSASLCRGLGALTPCNETQRPRLWSRERIHITIEDLSNRQYHEKFIQ